MWRELLVCWRWPHQGELANLACWHKAHPHAKDRRRLKLRLSHPDVVSDPCLRQHDFLLASAWESARDHVCEEFHTALMGHTPSMAGTFRKKFRKDPRNALRAFLEFLSRVRLGSPKDYTSRHLKAPKHFQSCLPPSTAGDASFFRSGSAEGLSEPVREFPAVLGAFLNWETLEHEFSSFFDWSSFIGRLILIHLQCWEVLPFLTIQRQWCIKTLFPKDPEFYTPLALNCQKGQQLSALEVYKNQSPI